MDVNSKEFARMVKEIAKKNNTDPDIVRNVIMSQFDCVRVNMKRIKPIDGFFPYIRLPYLFKFRVPERRKKYHIEEAKINAEYVRTEKRKSTD